MSEEADIDLQSYVHPGDILAAIKTIYGGEATVLSYDVNRATTSVQGFTSLMLRVKVIVKVNSSTIRETSLIIKRLPILEAQLKMMGNADFFGREVEYFQKALPLLKQQDSDVPVVQCFVAHNNTMVMEDLCLAGFNTIAENLKHVGEGVVRLLHARLIMRKLAKLHAASLNGTAWLNEIKFLNVDSLFEGNGAELFKPMFETANKSFAAILNEVYPQSTEKHRNWLQSPNNFEYLRVLSKSDPNFLNVLNHGDCWVNNMMFKVDPITSEPRDLKFIDLQVTRYAPPSRDILYFMYFCTDREFRRQHEQEILQVYLEALNAAICETPDRLTYAEFKAEYDKARLFGLLIALVIRPMVTLDGITPQGEEQLTNDSFDLMMHGDHTEEMLRQYKMNPTFRRQTKELLDELIEEIDKSQILV